MSDIVERLRSDGETVESLKAKGHWSSAKILEQADTITALRAEVERLRAALERLSCDCPSNCDWEKHNDICPSWIARAALEGK